MANRKYVSLTPAQVSEGIEACLANTGSLIDDADLLLKNGRHSRALTCALVALEEIGKITILLTMAGSDPDDKHSWRTSWQRLRRHSAKTQLTAALGVPIRSIGASANMPIIPESFWKAIKETAVDTEVSRQRTLYVDFDDRTGWTAPSDYAADASEIERLISLTSDRLEQAQAYQRQGRWRPDSLGIRRELMAPIMRRLSAVTAPNAAPSAEDLAVLYSDLLEAQEQIDERLEDEKSAGTLD